MIYLVEIGETSRRGNFIRHIQKAVSVTDECSGSDVSSYFAKKYEGFAVMVEPVPEIDITGEIKKPEPQPAAPPAPAAVLEKGESYLSDFKIKYTEEEEALHKEFVEAKDKSCRAKNALHRSITERYKAMYYTDIRDYGGDRYGMKLETDDCKTVCEKLPIKGNVFTSIAKSNKEDIDHLGDFDLPEDTARIEPTPEFPWATEPFPDLSAGGDMVSAVIDNMEKQADDVPF
jgi:hypothetical protein